MKKNAMLREYKKLKSQINNIDEVVRHSKKGAMYEHETSVRKKVLLLREMKNEGFKEYERTVDEYEDILKFIGERILEDYNSKNNSNFQFEEVIKGNFNTLLNSGMLALITKVHVPRVIEDEFKENFPDNPKDEYDEARAFKRKFILHLGDTNTGKTYNAMEKLKNCKKGVYLSPLRILALENYEKLNSQGVICDLLTGEEEIITPGATHTSCTVEKLNLKHEYEVAVIDEIQMIGDAQRGSAWTRAMLGVRALEVHLCGATNSRKIIESILKDCEDDYEIIEYTRNIPLIVEYEDYKMRDCKEGDALVVFSKKRVLELAKMYSDEGIKCSIIYGDLPPEARKIQYEKFINKENKVLITTDAIGMGVNLPIRRIIFLSIQKFDGEEIRYLTSQEVKQIAGRAGRKGIYEEGYVATISHGQSFVEDRILEKDEDVHKAVLGPSEAILKIKSLPLIEKLAIWSTREEKSPLYKKMDISHHMIVLECLKRYKLKGEEEWDLLKVPFDEKNESLLKQFVFYVDEVFVIKSNELTKPLCDSAALDDLEIYYQKINMYYSFCKIFNFDFDMEWIKNERIRISEEINEILMEI
ncbi:MAG: SUV3 family DEAD/DEAH box RNA helicase [Clostridium sp.]